MMVSPSAARPATTSAAPARMSCARTGAPDSRRHAADDGVVAVGADVGAEPVQLLDVAEAARVEVLGDDADAVGDATAW